MNWAIVGLVYAGMYAALVTTLADHAWARTVIGNIALLLPPLVPLAVLAKRRSVWRGNQAVFWGAIAAWAALWFAGQLGWAADEMLRATPLPWFKWHIMLHLCGSALPLIALVAWPHGTSATDSAVTVALDVTVLVVFTGFLYWSLIIAPGMDPAQTPFALRALAIIGPLVRLAAVIGLLAAAAAAGKSAWAAVYQRFAYGMILAFAVLVGLSLSTLRGDYRTGSAGDVGWMLPFWFAAWAAATSPASPPEKRATIGVWPTRHPAPVLLFAALLAVPIVGYGLRYLMPLGGRVDGMRELATTVTLAFGIGLVLIRLRVEHRAVELADQRVRLLATACEQAGELIIIVRNNRIEYANDVFCVASGYSREELESLPPIALLPPGSEQMLAALRDNLIAGKLTRATAGIARKDGTTFQAACAAAPIVDDAGRVTHFVVVIRDITEELRLREHLVRGERLSAIGEFVAGVAHELNNPLQSVIGTLELMLDQQQDPALRVDLERTRFEAGRAGRIVRNLLTFIRQTPNERLLVDLNEIVKSTVTVRAYELQMAGIETRENYSRLIPLVLASRDDIQQVLLNLIINAQQAMVAGSSTRVMSVRTFMIAGDAVVEVLDTGPGIPVPIAGRIFEPFFTTRSLGSGAGLGLSLSLGIAHAHNGKLELVPTASGCCFRLTLPGAGFAGPVPAHG